MLQRSGAFCPIYRGIVSCGVHGLSHRLVAVVPYDCHGDQAHQGVAGVHQHEVGELAAVALVDAGGHGHVGHHPSGPGQQVVLAGVGAGDKRHDRWNVRDHTNASEQVGGPVQQAARG